MTTPPQTLQPPVTARRVFQEPGFWLTGLPVLPILAFGALGGVTMYIYMYIVALSLPALLLIGAIWLGVSRPPHGFSLPARRAFALRRVAGVTLWLALMASVPLLNWPMRAVFAVSRPGLDDVANRVARGETVHYPVRCGLLTVHGASVSGLQADPNPAVGPRLWVDNSLGKSVFGGHFPGDELWLARGGFREGEWSRLDANHIMTNTEVARLSGDWFQVCEFEE